MGKKFSKPARIAVRRGTPGGHSSGGGGRNYRVICTVSSGGREDTGQRSSGAGEESTVSLADLSTPASAADADAGNGTQGIIRRVPSGGREDNGPEWVPAVQVLQEAQGVHIDGSTIMAAGRDIKVKNVVNVNNVVINQPENALAKAVDHGTEFLFA
ncbi:hypothetical protein FA15DRAFT_110250 [Coprinopsis marcescibilis]|uniref:Uncharacterized protein n=1 Tax=Coprinopsis marcescibilis TaxID=230819 RepID=A0A5C3KLG5_COPMA|nr:hypothetical protein FA15DRAFT_110250 [Coprinopsis marcescibilis]